MSQPLRILAQLNPAATTETDLLLAANPLVISGILVCNQSSSSGTFNLVLSPLGLASDTTMILYYNTEILGYSTFMINSGITLSKGDVLRCESSNGTMSFNVFGQEQ